MAIQNARSNTSGNAPSSLAQGQIALNQTDGFLFWRNTAGTIRTFFLNIATSAEILLNTAFRLVSVTSLWSSQIFVTLTDATTIAVDMGTFANAKVTLAGNRTLGTPTNAKEGQSGVILVTQDATGSRTLSYATGWDFGSSGAPTLSTAANKTDTISYVVINATGPVVRAYFGKSA